MTDQKRNPFPKPAGSGGSGEHQLQLEEHLAVEPKGSWFKAEMEFEKAKQQSTPPIRDLPPTRPAMTSSEEIDVAAITLRESVDRVCEALVLVFGKITSVSDLIQGQTFMLRRLLHWMVFVAVVQVLVAVAMVATVVVAMATNRSQDKTITELTELAGRVAQVEKSSQETKEAVEKQDKPTIELAADPSKPGSAVVRIRPTQPSVAGSVEIPVRVEASP